MARIKISVTLDQSLVRELDQLSVGSSRSEIVEARLGLSLQEWKQPCRRLYQSLAAEDRTVKRFIRSKPRFFRDFLHV